MGNMFSNTLVETVNKCDNDYEADGCDRTAKIDGKRVTISIQDYRDVKPGYDSYLQMSEPKGDDEMNYLVKLNKNNKCDGELKIEFKCPDPNASTDDNEDDASTDAADASTDAADASADDSTAANVETSSQEPFINYMDNKKCILLVVIIFTLWIYRKKILKILK